jgi:DNA-binding response OmpR family regulator
VAGELIAVIEDEETIRSAVVARLEKEGFRVESAEDGPSAVALCERVSPDLVVLDIMLPGFDGLEVCRQIQRDRAVPVIMLTARDGETDLLVGLGVGADDYMTKPFSNRELVARVKALLRRAARPASDTFPVLRFADVEIDPMARRVRRGDENVHLTPTEFDLLHRLAARPDVVFTRDRLMREVWGYVDVAGARTVDSHIATLRRKLGSELIRTVHGVGYAFGGAA